MRLLALWITITMFPTSAQAAMMRIDRPSDQLYIVGKIVAGDYDQFVDVIKRSNDDILAVNIVSPGGSTIEAIKIGQLIRRLYLATNAPSLANFAPEARRMICSIAASIDRSTSCSCASACFLIWSAGVERSGNDIHIHRIAFDADYYGSLPPNVASQKYQEALQVVHSYLREMEIPDSIYEEMVSMPSYTTALLQQANWAWPPSFAEWLTARCGPPTRRDSMCELQQRTAATRQALREYRSHP